MKSKMDALPKYEATDYQAAGKLEGKVVVITSGDSGIGRPVAVLLALERTPMKRPGQLEEVAPAFVFFVSHADSSDITGEALTRRGSEIRAG